MSIFLYQTFQVISYRHTGYKMNLNNNNTMIAGTLIKIAVQLSNFTWEIEFSKQNPNQLLAGFSTRILRDVQDSLKF